MKIYWPKLLSLTLILTILGNIVMQPLGAQAAPQLAETPATAAIVESGELLMTAAPQATGNALELAQLMAYIQQTGLENVAESTLIHARQNALETAQQAAHVQGAVGAMVNGITDLGYQSQPAVDMDAVVADLSATGFEAEVETTLADFGLTPAQIDMLAGTAAGNFNARRSPLPADTRTFLADMGLTSTEIDQLEQALADYGLADSGLSTKLAQLQATQQEMSGVRSEALVVYLQLLTQQVFVRQQAGAQPRQMSTAEVEEVINDQLRLLIHTGYLESLGTSDPNVGEGQWLFIERYSLRVAERLDALILETQNLGLLVDLLVALQLHSTSLAALAGDAEYAQAEMEPLADFLAALLGDNGASGQGYRHATPPFWWAEALALGSYTPAGLTDIIPDPAAVATAQAQAQTRIKGLAAPLWFPAAQAGAVDEADETNNQHEIVFATSFADIPPDLLDQLLYQLQSDPDTVAIWRILVGQPDNPAEVAANVTLSFYPITGILLDFIALRTDPTTWGRAMALIGLTASILTDGGEVLGALGLTISPVGLFILTVDIGAESLDAGAALLRNVKTFVTPHVFGLIAKIDDFKAALKLGVEIMDKLARKTFKGVSSLPTGSADEIAVAVYNLMKGHLDEVWQPFEALLRFYGNNPQFGGLKRIFTLGFDEGGFLAGMALTYSDEAVTYGDDVVQNVAKIGDRWGGEVVYSLGDEATAGVGKLAQRLKEKAQGVANILCVGGVAQIANYRAPGLASPLIALPCDLELLDKVLANIKQWDQAALNGFERLAQAGVDDEALATFLLKYADDPTTANRLLNIINNLADDTLAKKTFLVLKKMTTSWSENAMMGVADLITRVKNQDASQVLAVIEETGGADLGERLFRLVHEAEQANLDGWPGFARKMVSIKNGPNELWGNSHVLFFIEEKGGFSQFSRFERYYPNPNGSDRLYDLVDTQGALYELKNIAEMRYDDYKQLATDLQLLTDNELRNLTWVFRGSEADLPFSKQSIISDLVNHISGRRDLSPNMKQNLLRKIQQGIFGENNILFTGGKRPYP